jgi:hypothetical protein
MTISKATARATLAGHDERLTDVQVDQAELMLSMLAEPTRLRMAGSRPRHRTPHLRKTGMIRPIARHR